MTTTFPTRLRARSVFVGTFVTFVLPGSDQRFVRDGGRALSADVRARAKARP